MKAEKIGNTTFWPEVSQEGFDRVPASCHFTTDEAGLHLTIQLDTEDRALAVQRGRRIIRLWQLSEGMLTDDKLAAIYQHADLLNAVEELKIAILNDVLSVVRTVKKFVGRRRGPGPTLQPGRVSRDPTQSDKQGKCQE